MTRVNDITNNQRVINEIKILKDDFIRQETEGESSETFSRDFLDYILKRERVRRGVSLVSSRQEAVDHQTIEALKNVKLGPELAEVEAILRRLGHDPVDALKYYQRLKEQKSLKMSEIGSKERPKSRKPFTVIIDEIVGKNPLISQNELLHQLKKHEDINVSDNKIVCSDTRHEMTVDALREALSRSKKKLQKN